MQVAYSRPVEPALSLRLLIITSIRLYREGLAETLARLPDVAAVATASGGLEALDRVASFDPHIALLDMSGQTGAEIAQALVCAAPGLKVVALGVPETESHVLACAEAGIVGYVPRDGTLDDLVSALLHVARGEAVCSPKIAAVLMSRVAALTRTGRAERPAGRLTRREQEIVDLVALGLANRDIARKLGIELCTVKNHVHNILEKLGARHRSEVAARVRAWA
jgi:DNA-binding NarL/FixJ family response regulator